MGVSIGLLAAMLQRKTDSSVEQRLEVEAPCEGLLFGAGQAEQGGNGRKARKSGDGPRLLTRKTSKGVSPRSPGI